MSPPACDKACAGTSASLELKSHVHGTSYGIRLSMSTTRSVLVTCLEHRTESHGLRLSTTRSVPNRIRNALNDTSHGTPTSKHQFLRSNGVWTHQPDTRTLGILSTRPCTSFVVNGYMTGRVATSKRVTLVSLTCQPCLPTIITSHTCPSYLQILGWVLMMITWCTKTRR